MSSEFACPECGYPVHLSRHAAGRHLRCDHCGTMIEVPFLPRAVLTPRRSAPLVPPVVWALAGFLTLLSLAIMAGKLAWRNSAHATAAAEMLAIRSRAEEAWQADQLDEALAGFDTALKRVDLPWGSEVVASFRHRRETAVHKITERDLERLERLGPDDAIRDGLTLHARIEDDPQLEGDRDLVRAAVRRAVERRFERDLNAAERALEAGQPGPALATAEGLQQLANTLPHWAGGPPPDRLMDLMKRIAARHGAVVEPIQGNYRLGSAEAYEKAIRPLLREGLQAKGYAVEPADPGLAPIWTTSAPNRLSLEIVEREGGRYLQSANTVAQLEARLLFRRPGKVDWKQTIQAETEVPLRGLPAFEASRLANSKSSPEAQRRFHDNAFQTLVGRVGKVAAAVPTPTQQ